MYKISVIVPVYNTEKYLKKCVESLRKQTYSNIEILLIDDGSKDQSGKLCDEYDLIDSRIRTIHKENGGLISAWTRGVKESTGEYLCFVDSDDWVDQEMLAEMAEHLTGNRKEIVASDYVIERVKGRKNTGEEYESEPVFQQLPAGEYRIDEIKKQVIPNLLGHEKRYITVSRCMKLISRVLIEDQLHYLNPKVIMGEDLSVMLPAFIDCERLYIMDHKTYYHYLYVQDSMVHKYDCNLVNNINLLVKTIHQVLEDKFSGQDLEKRKKEADRETILLYLLIVKNEARGNPRGYQKQIRQFCRAEETKALIKNTPVQVSGSANKLLYRVLKSPGIINLWLLRLAMVIYYR